MIYRSVIFLAIITSIVPPLLASNWALIGDESVSVDYETIDYDGSIFVAAGEGRRFAMSSDGVNWKTHILDVNEFVRFGLTSVTGSTEGWLATFRTFSGGRFLSAKHPTDWTYPNTITNANYVDAAAGNGVKLYLRSNGRSVVRITSNTSQSESNLPQPNDYNSITYGNGVFIACGENGGILSSNNGAGWAARSSGVSANLLKIKFENGEFICVGEDRTILRSKDGQDWEIIHSGGDIAFYDITSFRDSYYLIALSYSAVFRADEAGFVEDLGFYGVDAFAITSSQSRIVLCGGRGLLAYSGDGEKWFNLDTRNGHETNAYAVLPELGILTRNPESGLEYTPNLSTWYSSLAEEEYSVPFAHDNRFFIFNLITSKVYESSNGVNWQNASGIPPIDFSVNEFKSLNNVLFALDNGVINGVLRPSFNS